MGDQTSSSVTLCIHQHDGVVCDRERAGEVHGTGTDYTQSDTSRQRILPTRSVHPTHLLYAEPMDVLFEKQQSWSWMSQKVEY